MSFRASANKVRDEALSPWQRLVALRCCIQNLTLHSGESYYYALQRFDERFGFNRYRPRTDPPMVKQLCETLTAVERERNILLDRGRVEAIRNLRAKLRHRERQRSNLPSTLFGLHSASARLFRITTALHRPTLVFCGATWDSNSARFAVILRRWRSSTSTWSLLTLDIDTERNRLLYNDLEIVTTPTLFVYQRGKLLARREGVFRHQGTTDESYQTFLDWLTTTGAVE